MGNGVSRPMPVVGGTYTGRQVAGACFVTAAASSVVTLAVRSFFSETNTKNTSPNDDAVLVPKPFLTINHIEGFSSVPTGTTLDNLSLKLGSDPSSLETSVLAFVTKNNGAKVAHVEICHHDCVSGDSLYNNLSMISNNGLQVVGLTISDYSLSSKDSLDLKKLTNTGNSLNTFHLIADSSSRQVETLTDSEKLIKSLGDLRLKTLRLTDFPEGSVGVNYRDFSHLQELEELHWKVLPKKQPDNLVISTILSTLTSPKASSLSIDPAVAGLKSSVKVFLTFQGEKQPTEDEVRKAFKTAVDAARQKSTNQSETGPKLVLADKEHTYPYSGIASAAQSS